MLTEPEPFPDILEFLRVNALNTFQTGSPLASSVSCLGRGSQAVCVPPDSEHQAVAALCVHPRLSWTWDQDRPTGATVRAAASALPTAQMIPVPPDNSLGILCSHLLPQTCMWCQVSLL